MARCTALDDEGLEWNDEPVLRWSMLKQDCQSHLYRFVNGRKLLSVGWTSGDKVQ